MQNKKVFAVLMAMALIMTLLVQQLQTNAEAKTQNDPLTNVTQDIFKKATSEEDCLCSKGENDNKNYEKVDLVKDKNIINNLKNQLNSWESEGVSYYKTNDFKWDETSLTKYNDEQHALVVPLNNISRNKVVFLFAGYDLNTNEILNPVLIEFTKRADNNNVDKVNYKTLDNIAVVGFKFSEDGKFLEKIVYEENVENYGSDNSINGYWDNVATCLRKTWKTLPAWLRTACEAACFSVIFGGNAIGASVCAACLGGHVMDCMMRG